MHGTHLQNGPSIVDSADEAGSLAGCRDGGRLERRGMARKKRGGRRRVCECVGREGAK